MTFGLVFTAVLVAVAALISQSAMHGIELRRLARRIADLEAMLNEPVS